MKNQMKIKDVEQIKSVLENIDPQYLMYAIKLMGQVYVPQCYYNEHAQELGFEDVTDMAEQLEDFEIYSHVNEIVQYAIDQVK